MRGQVLLAAALLASVSASGTGIGGAPVIGYERDRVAGDGMSVPRPKSQKKRRKQRRQR